RFKNINEKTEVINNYPILNELISDGNSSKKLNQVASVGGLSSIRGSKELAEASMLTNSTIKVAGATNDLINKNRLILLGQLDRNEVKELLSESLAGLITFLPEPNHVNAKPNKMFEYMSASLPIICSNFQEWEDLIIENKNGISVNPKKPKEIAEAIDYFIQNPNDAKMMEENGRIAIEKKYNWEKESKKLFEIYYDLLEEN